MNKQHEPMSEAELAELERVFAASTQGDWSIPHFADDTTTCNCVYVLSEGYAGSICDIGVDNGLKIADGGNDDPPLEEAKANAQFIPMAHNAFPRLLATIRAERERKEGIPPVVQNGCGIWFTCGFCDRMVTLVPRSIYCSNCGTKQKWAE